ncbi:MAG: pH regulation protein F [Trueperaceae bacterium]|nr:pH regulation protein F [Trueperaceae bacterium]
MTDLPLFFQISVYIGFASVAISLLLAFIRLIIGQSLADRVVALDLMVVLVIAFIALFAIARQETVFLDANIALALVAFLSTVAFARYVEWQRQQSKTKETSHA